MVKIPADNTIKLALPISAAPDGRPPHVDYCVLVYLLSIARKREKSEVARLAKRIGGSPTTVSGGPVHRGRVGSGRYPERPRMMNTEVKTER